MTDNSRPDWQAIANERGARIVVLETQVDQWEYEAKKILGRMRHTIMHLPRLDATLAFNSGYLQGRYERYEEALQALLPRVEGAERALIQEALS